MVKRRQDVDDTGATIKKPGGVMTRSKARMAADVEPADKAPKMTLMLLPEEILVLILWQLFSLASPGKSSSNEPGIRRWFKYELPARSLETLQTEDICLTLGDGPEDYYALANPDFLAFGDADPWQFDLSCSRLLQVLPETEFRDLVPRFEHLVEQVGVGFPRLRHVLLMDGNAGISIKDYANLFLIPRDICNIQADGPSKSATIAECGGDSEARCNGLTTACPSLESLTLVLWYSCLLIDAKFLAAMSHLRQHHPNFEELTLISRRLRCDIEASLDGSFKISQWFQDAVVPILRSAAEQLLKHKLRVTIYVMTRDYLQTNYVQDGINRYWTPVLDKYVKEHEATIQGSLNVEAFYVREYRPTVVYQQVAKHHKIGFRIDHLKRSKDSKPSEIHPATWINPSTVTAFFDR